MLTVEVLKANEALKGLSAEQMEAIAAMSKNDEEVVIGKRIGELHGSYDNDILSVTSVAKKDGEKSYDYLKRVLTDYKTKAAEREQLRTKLQESEQKVESLQKQVDGGSAEISKQLKDEKDLTAQLKQQLKDKETALTDAQKEYEAKLLGFRVDSAFEAVFGTLNFRQDVTDSVKAAMKAAAKSEVLAKGSFSWDETRGELVLRDSKGEIVRNQANNMNPYTVAELVGETSIKDVLAKAKTGNGTTPPSGGGGGQVTAIDLTSAKTQTEADEAISAYLAAKGVTMDSPTYWDEFTKVRDDNNVSALPMR